jgi:antitoxin (DNA-binding transcriptional repressor) of toxin-antitoxin stability system
MKELEIQETDTTLMTLVDQLAANSSEVIITRNGKPIARIIPFEITSSKGNYPLRGIPISISEDFDEPMPELWEALGE